MVLEIALRPISMEIRNYVIFLTNLHLFFKFGNVFSDNKFGSNYFNKYLIVVLKQKYIQNLNDIQNLKKKQNE